MPHTKVKLCGLTNLDDAILAARLGYNYLGFIVNVVKSPRSISSMQLKSIHHSLVVTGLRAKVKFVAVFVDEPLDSLMDISSSRICDVLQLHGNETIYYCQQLKLNIEIWKALVQKDNQSSSQFEQQVQEYLTNVDKVLIDCASAQDKLTGTKTTGYDELLAKFDFAKDNLVLSGGINLKNINEKLKQYNPATVDLSSGVESSPGKKDAEKMREFINIINKYNETI